MLRRALPLTILLASSLSGPAARADGPPLELEWCTGSMPASWGFAVTPSEECRSVHVRTNSAAVLLTSARGGPGLPPGWRVTSLDAREAVAEGPTALPAGVRFETFLLVETNRSTGAIDSRGALPVEWGVWFAGADGAPTASGKMTASFPPVMPLQDAAGKGMVLVSHEGLGAAGPIELTVDNPTWFPLWLDVPTGTVVSAEGRDWVIASCAPFRMMRKQKTGRTVTAFPLLPPSTNATPRRLSWSKPASPELVARARELAVAADRLQDRSRRPGHVPGGPFERANPFDFWPLALRWATWTAGPAVPPTPLEPNEMGPPAPPPLPARRADAPSRDLLLGHLTQMRAERVAKGDPAAQAMDAAAATAEVEAAADAIVAEAALLAMSPLPIELQAAKERFR